MPTLKSFILVSHNNKENENLKINILSLEEAEKLNSELKININNFRNKY